MLAQIIVTNTVTITNTVSDLTGAISTLVHSALPHLTGQQDLDVVGLILILARVLRKVVPDELQTGKAGQVLKHIALEVNPIVGELKPVITAVEPIVASLVTEELNKTQAVTGQVATPVISQPTTPLL